jgi:uncharacterized membrane protein
LSENFANQSGDEKRDFARLLPLDALRGLIMVLMALDHANHFVAQKHSLGENWGGDFPAYHDAFTFLTRFVTHLAAPGFFFLMGAGMLLFARSRRKQGWSEWAIIGHFILRGGLLIALQFLIVNRAWELSAGGWGLDIYVGVLFALGGTMILGSLVLWLDPKYLLALTIVLFLGTELLTPAPGQWNEAFSPLQRLLLVPGGDPALWVNYPVLPWLELVTFGMVFAYGLAADSGKAFTRGLWLGAAFLLAFAVVRFLNGFGNIRPRGGDDWIAVLNVVKYPPSLAFTLLTMGVNLIVLGLFSRVGGRVQRFALQPLAVFGRVPLFFYLLHLFWYAALGIWFTPNGTNLPVMVLYWLLGLLLLYPLCLGYGRFKGRQHANSVWRFL